MAGLFAILVVATAVTFDTTSQAPSKSVDEIQSAVEKCHSEVNVDQSILDQAFVKGQFVDDKNFKCFLKCMFVTMEDMTESGELLLDNIKSHIAEQVKPYEATEIIDKCVKAVDDPCDTAFNIVKCSIEEGVKMRQQ